MFSILRNRDFGLLWLAGLISYAGDFALIVAMPLHIYSLTGSATATAGGFAAYFLPGVLFGSIAGVFVDRWDRKRTMVVTHLLRALILLPLLAAPDSLVLLYVVSATQGVIGLFFRPAEGAFLPTLVGKERLVAANAMNALNDNFGRLLGPAVGALLYSTSGIAGVALLDAATYVAGALLIGLIVADGRPARAEDAAVGGSPVSRMLSDWRAGLRVVRRNRSLSVLAAASSLSNVAEGVFLTLGLAPLVLDVLGGTAAQVGWLATAQAVGGLIAGVLLVRIGHRLTMRWLAGGGLVGVGLADFTAFNAHRLAAQGTPAVGVAMGSMGFAGFPVVAYGAGEQSLVQTHAADAYRGRVFGAIRAVGGVAMLIGLAIGGVLGDAIGLVPVLTASALVRVLSGVVALVFLPRQDDNPDIKEDTLRSVSPVTTVGSSTSVEGSG